MEAPTEASLLADFPSLSGWKLPLQQALRVEANASELTTAASSDIVDPVYPGCRASNTWFNLHRLRLLSNFE